MQYKDVLWKLQLVYLRVHELFSRVFSCKIMKGGSVFINWRTAGISFYLNTHIQQRLTKLKRSKRAPCIPKKTPIRDVCPKTFSSITH
uniref:Uncharacterized protein n=1 Tax=Pyxicephalus adspersus TaxID=30357 RepID=A0AAV2ZSV7_PYXAD|nr:TPA: hypothetical protein GDO54_002710 [Pyxicephalus adspersus]